MTGTGFVVVSTQPNRADAELLAGLLRSGGMPVVVEPAQDAEYDVRDYLAWRASDSGADEAPGQAETDQLPAAPMSLSPPELHAPRLPLLPVVGLVALVVALVVLLR